jgi:tetratricopeptide (TPR) repeat protein
VDPSRRAEHIERLAQHALRGELWEQAALYLPQAGAKALERGANVEAAAYFEQALTALAHLPDSRARIEQAIDLRLELRNTVLITLDFHRALDNLRVAESLARAAGDQQRLARISAHKTHSLWLVGEYEHAIAAGEEAVAIADVIGDFSIRIAATQYRGQVFRTIGSYPEAIRLFRQTIASLEGDLRHARFGMHALPAVLARVFLADCLAMLGQFDEALAQAREAIQIADHAGHPFSIVAAHAAFSLIFVNKGDPDILSFVERGAELCRVWNVRVWLSSFLTAISLARTLSGHIAETLPTLEEARKEVILRVTNTPRLPDLSRAFCFAGRPDEARELANVALEQSRDDKQRGIYA